MDDTLKWNFPKHIVFEDVSDLMKKFDAKKNNNIIFNLSRTTRAHSSFIGFLIYAKSTVEKKWWHFQTVNLTTHQKTIYNATGF